MGRINSTNNSDKRSIDAPLNSITRGFGFLSVDVGLGLFDFGSGRVAGSRRARSLRRERTSGSCGIGAGRWRAMHGPGAGRRTVDRAASRRGDAGAWGGRVAARQGLGMQPDEQWREERRRQVEERERVGREKTGLMAAAARRGARARVKESGGRLHGPNGPIRLGRLGLGFVFFLISKIPIQIIIKFIIIKLKLFMSAFRDRGGP
jgi:hypothetical protein